MRVLRIMNRGITMDEHVFRQFLEHKSLSESSIDHYCSYIRSIVKKCSLDSWDRLVESKNRAQHYISKLVNSPMFLGVPSARCYRRAICLLYECKYHEVLDSQQFPQWGTDIKRKYENAHPEAHAQWYQEIIVDDPHHWLTNIIMFNRVGVFGVRSWAFRGQGDSEWKLETTLGRVACYAHGSDPEKGRYLKLFEQETMWEFRRESAKWSEYRGFDGIDLLSLVQHYGGKTRLLDFSLAPLLALYMAVESNGTDYAKVVNYKGLDKENVKQRDFAVWALDLSRILGGSGCQLNQKDRTVEDAFWEADEIVKARDCNGSKGIFVIFPKTCNERLSAQDGLFLMPKSLDCSFEENLIEELSNKGQSGDHFRRKYLSEIRDGFMERNDASMIIKFVFPVDVLPAVKDLLAEANVMAKHVYPDLTGLGKYVSGIIEEHSQKWR